MNANIAEAQTQNEESPIAARMKRVRQELAISLIEHIGLSNEQAVELIEKIDDGTIRHLSILLHPVQQTVWARPQ